MGELREAMSAFLKDWQDDLSPAWRTVLSSVEPALDQIPGNLSLEDSESIFPGRKGNPALGARPDSHVFRALEGLRPQDVNAVVLGQDPYPKASRATGRSFEQGDLPAWVMERSRIAESLRRILQVVAHFRTGQSNYVRGDDGWEDVVRDSSTTALNISPPETFFDEWQRQGILCLNAGLTLSRFQVDVQRAHVALWRPVVERIFSSLVQRRGRPIAFLLWGKIAATTFSQLRVLEAAEKAGTRDQVVVVRHAHPGAEDNQGKALFFAPPNTFVVASERLIAIGGPTLDW